MAVAIPEFPGLLNTGFAATDHSILDIFSSFPEQCQARREKYVKQMKKSVEVDVYGKCGKLKCDRSDEAGCYTQLENNYRFYLSFENSVCEEELETKLKQRFVIMEKAPTTTREWRLKDSMLTNPPVPYDLCIASIVG